MMFAVVAVLLLTLINVAGIRTSTNASKIMAMIKVGVLVLFTLLGISTVKGTNYESFTSTGVHSGLEASTIVFFAYTEYTRIATLDKEIKEFEKTISRAILISLAITAIISVIVTTVGIGLVGTDRLRTVTRQ
ncbi:MAG: basic amino acid/polyamine antiporter, family [Thermoproteota archaeon]|nr:basic amino acid/polyamine antiporter, family [Thermoproteota archaeon]